MHEPDPPPWIASRHRQIGERVRVARLGVNVTQEGLRERTGLSRDTVIRIEAGTTDARLSWLLLIAAALDVPLAELVAE